MGDLKIPPGISPQAKDLITRMIVKNADSRLGAHDLDEIRSHPFFSGVVFHNAHEKAPPVPSLVECCTRHFGRNFKTMQAVYEAWPKRAELDPRITDILERIRLSQQWQDD